MLGHDLEMACTQFYANQCRIDGEIDEKHALQIYEKKFIDIGCLLYASLG